MRTIRNNYLFQEMRKNPENEADTLFGNLDYKDMLESHGFIYFAGGLDHVHITKKGYYFIDIGCNNKDSSFVLRQELEKK